MPPTEMTSPTLSVQRATEDNESVRELMDRTLVSLLLCFNANKKNESGKPAPRFYTYVRKDELPYDGTYRDTAIVLTAIEGVAKDLMDYTHTDGAKQYKDFKDQLTKNLRAGDRQQISYDSYKCCAFEPSLEAISSGEPVDVLGDPDEPVTLLSGSGRDAFSCARILELLNWYSRERTHGAVWVDAVADVVGSLSQSHGPHFAFGGASIGNKTPDAFVSDYCIAALLSIVRTLRDRKEKHDTFSELLLEFDRWMNSKKAVQKKDDLHLVYSSWENYVPYLRLRLEPIKDAVGIAHMAEAFWKLVAPIKGRKSVEPDSEALRQELLKACKGKVKPWLREFAKLANRKIDRLVKTLAPPIPRKYQAKERTAKERTAKEWIEASRNHIHSAGTAWELAFFRGIQHVLKAITRIYSKLTAASTLKEIAQAIADAGEEWGKSELATREYIERFAQWGLAELRRQIAFHAVPRHSSVDPVQLAFSVRIVHGLTKDNKHLIAKGLEILAETQDPDGTWRIGVPLAFDPANESTIHVINLEIANVIAPIIQKDLEGHQPGGERNYRLIERHYRLLERIHNWLRINHREITPKGFDHKIGGWTSDKIVDRKRVDVWVGGLALKFLHSYQKFLQEYVNSETVKDKYDYSRPPSPAWKDVVDPKLNDPYSKRITTTIFDSYIQPFHLMGENRFSSMVLYGPPGTGKTTYADAIAKALNWHRVTITPSDFVKEGIEKSESLARTLFEDLLRLREVVVLFDEIDEMLRSRSSTKAEQSQMAMLRFLIPGMLPKLQHLKQHGEKKGLIFIIATNYKERLDPAIARTGRIDHHFAVYPHDLRSRSSVLYRMLKKGKIGEPMRSAEILAGVTQGWVYKELENLVKLLPQRAKEKMCSVSDLITRMEADDPKYITPVEKGSSWRGNDVLGLRRALDLEQLYMDRLPYAVDEATEVLRICDPELTGDRVNEIIASGFQEKTG